VTFRACTACVVFGFDAKKVMSNASAVWICGRQLIDMTGAELQWLSSHLGHDVTTHKKNYRLHPNSVEITRVGKLLMAIDNGQYTGEGIKF